MAKNREVLSVEARSYLIYLAFPCTLSFMRPRTERRLPGLGNRGAGRVVYFRWIRGFPSYGHHNSPSAFARMPDMLSDGVIILLPTVERSLAQVTCRVVGAD